MYKFVYSIALVFTLCLSTTVHAKNILVLGDSISAGYGLEKVEQGWVYLLKEQLKPTGVDVINASISGETSAGGLSRIDGLLKQHHPAIVIVELGGNDGLRGLPPSQMEFNLLEIIKRARTDGAEVLLLGMKIPPNYGRQYTEMFHNVYKKLAEQHNVMLVPFLLDGIGGSNELMQADRIHPNRNAQPILLQQVNKSLKGLLARLEKP